MSKAAKRRPPKRKAHRSATPYSGSGFSNGSYPLNNSNGNGSTGSSANGGGISHDGSLNGAHNGSRNGNGSVVSSRVLLLNQNYEPLTICTAKRAIVMTLTGTVQVVEKHDKLAIHSVSRTFDLPTVIRLDRYVSAPRKRVLLNRRNILARDNHRCQYCNSPGPNLTIDHVIARRHGGEDSWENLVAACVSCNSKKGNRTPEQAGMRLQRKPKRPNRISFIRQSARSAHSSWRPYLFMD